MYPMYLWYLIKEKLQIWYLTHKYSKLRPGIYHDQRLNVWVSSNDPTDYRDIDHVLERLTKYNLVYHYKLGNRYVHCHTFHSVLIDAYNRSEIFEIDPYDKSDYSEQELEWIARAILNGKRDREVYDNLHKLRSKDGWRC